MTTRTYCDYPGCEQIAVTRITEDRLDDLVEPHFVGQAAPSFGRALDACKEHRMVTHPGWWCHGHEDILREQAARSART